MTSRLRSCTSPPVPPPLAGRLARCPKTPIWTPRCTPTAPQHRGKIYPFCCDVRAEPPLRATAHAPPLRLVAQPPGTAVASPAEPTQGHSVRGSGTAMARPPLSGTRFVGDGHDSRTARATEMSGVQHAPPPQLGPRLPPAAYLASLLERPRKGRRQRSPPPRTADTKALEARSSLLVDGVVFFSHALPKPDSVHPLFRRQKEGREEPGAHPDSSIAARSRSQGPDRPSISPRPSARASTLKPLPSPSQAEMAA